LRTNGEAGLWNKVMLGADMGIPLNGLWLA